MNLENAVQPQGSTPNHEPPRGTKCTKAGSFCALLRLFVATVITPFHARDALQLLDTATNGEIGRRSAELRSGVYGSGPCQPAREKFFGGNATGFYRIKG